jgi:histone H1/5
MFADSRLPDSRQAIKKYIQANNKITATPAAFDSLFNRNLKAGVTNGDFTQPKGKSLPVILLQFLP